MVDEVLVQGFHNLLSWVSLGVLLFTAFAFADAAFRREDAYRAADKQTKPFWLIVLGLAVVVNLLPIGLFFLVIIGLIAAIVYLVDVRPAIKQISGGGRGGGRRGSSSDGPYGPYNGGR
ncbi:DUF2516 family protein [Streptomyces pathocidini]|uniref:DUF2516 family protein n=1 Tax=Streptomyces pathocidini TaxID=1650571 RepID=A0ABW7UW27_9ACTN|nr:DUF2516 family protein [Streptomyces pathocidini]